MPGYQWSGVKQWASQHPKAWIADSAGNYRYEAHHYWDGDNSSTYAKSYQDEVTGALAAGYQASPASTTTNTTVASTTSTTVSDTSPPTVPTTLTSNSGKRKVTLSWGGSTDSGGSGLAGYEVYSSTSQTGPYTLVDSTTTTSYTNSSLTRSQTYWYYVKAYDLAGNRSPQSNLTSATVI
ncbi:MAG: hypothetical protein ACR2G7_14145 [Acidimicrobiales bacterium]